MGNTYRFGWYLAALQLFFALCWTVYAIYFPKLAATAGIALKLILIRDGKSLRQAIAVRMPVHRSTGRFRRKVKRLPKTNGVVGTTPFRALHSHTFRAVISPGRRISRCSLRG